MGIEYRELCSPDDFSQGLELQRRVFGFSETDLISPLFFHLIRRNDPPIGINLGVFETSAGSSHMIGLMIGFATFLEKSVYTVLLGVLAEYQEGVYGYKLLLKFREIALAKGIQTMHGVFEPLQAILGRLYAGGVGFIATRYLVDASPAAIPADKFLFRWDFSSEHTVSKLDRTGARGFRELSEKASLVKPGEWPENPLVRVEIPADWPQLVTTTPEVASAWRLETRAILEEYINRRQYAVIDCQTEKAAGTRKVYYLLQKRHAPDYT